MNTVAEPFEVQQITSNVEAAEVWPAPFTTTLFDLIAALHAVVEPDEDALVVATVVHLLRSGRLTFLDEVSEALLDVPSELTR